MFEGDYDPQGDYSATSLIDSPRVRALRSLHYMEMESDVSERLDMLIGSAVHSIIERGAQHDDNYISEERIVVDFDGKKISGKADLICSNGLLLDIKCTKVFSYLQGGRDSWVKQLNIYKYLYEKSGYVINKLQIFVILLDWNQTQAENNAEYPQQKGMYIDIEIMPDRDVEDYIRERINLHEEAAFGNLPECTKDERWCRDSVYAIRKSGGKRAVSGGLHDTEEEALAHMEELGAGHEVDYRPGRSIRCERDACGVSRWCGQWALANERFDTSPQPVI